MNSLRVTGERDESRTFGITGSLSVVLQTVRMEIDDDDEDIVEVMLNLTNESAIPIGGIAATIQTSLGATVEPVEGVSSIYQG